MPGCVCFFGYSTIEGLYSGATSYGSWGLHLVASGDGSFYTLRTRLWGLKEPRDWIQILWDREPQAITTTPQQVKLEASGPVSEEPQALAVPTHPHSPPSLTSMMSLMIGVHLESW